MSAKCQYVGNADAAPPKPTKAPVPTNLWCDMSKYYGYINGNFRLRGWAPDGSMLDSKVRCENGKCTVPSDRRWNFELFSKLPVLKLNILVK